jgi:hypothetical protein
MVALTGKFDDFDDIPALARRRAATRPFLSSMTSAVGFDDFRAALRPCSLARESVLRSNRRFRSDSRAVPRKGRVWAGRLRKRSTPAEIELIFVPEDPEQPREAKAPDDPRKPPQEKPKQPRR